ncbi:MAG: YifB family Mg chelatase-like AAA ATPase [Actinomycetes bacterium]
MALARACGVVVNGVEGLVVDIEAYLSQGLPGMTIVGLPDTSVGESRDRVRAAVLNSELTWPAQRRITVGLSPASIHKRGASLDLGIALAILAAHSQVPEISNTIAVGELALDGQVRPVRGVLVAALAAHRRGYETLIVPLSQVCEAQLVPGLRVIGVRTLLDAVAYLRGELNELPQVQPLGDSAQVVPDLCDVRGQSNARHALEIAAAGGHHLAFLGSPGVGKTMLAQRLPGLLPQLTDEQAIEVTAIYSAAGLLPVGQGLIRTPPFQGPHHTTTKAALIGGGSNTVRVGMVTLANHGVLCLDEAAEFERSVLDALRQPMESGLVAIARAGFSTVLPARFQLVLASNPCPCGKFVGIGADCSCSSQVRRRYFSRLSGPLLDRIDLRVTLERPSMAELDPSSGEPESTQVVAARVLEARARAAHRFAGEAFSANSQVPGPLMRKRYPVSTKGQSLLYADSSTLSARGVDRVLRVSWTIADLRGHDIPTQTDVAAALMYRDGNGSWQAS